MILICFESCGYRKRRYYVISLILFIYFTKCLIECLKKIKFNSNITYFNKLELFNFTISIYFLFLDMSYFIDQEQIVRVLLTHNGVCFCILFFFNHSDYSWMYVFLMKLIYIYIIMHLTFWIK